MRLLFLILLITTLTSCSEFIEYPLENEKVNILAPTDSYTTQDSVISFWWSTHEDAKYYRIQVVKPDFSNTDRIFIDSIVWDDKVVLKLDAGTYSWRVRPENDGSVGNYVERNFRVLAKP